MVLTLNQDQNQMLLYLVKKSPTTTPELVAWFSHHVILYHNGRVIVIPTSEVTRFELGNTQNVAPTLHMDE